MKTREIEILGMKEIQEILKVLPSKVSKPMLLRALKRASFPIGYQAKMNAPRRRGVTKAAIVTVKSREQDPAVLISVTKGRGVPNDAWYAKFQEFGTSGFTRRMVRGGVTYGYKSTRKYKGKTRTISNNVGLEAKEFMQRALADKKELAMSTLNVEISKVIVPYLRRKAPKYYAA